MYLYIVGRGHSGSTILDVLLGNAAVTASVGELVAIMGKPAQVCSCGASAAECPFWSQVRAKVEAAGVDYQALAAASRAQAHVGRLPTTILARPGAHPDLDRLAAATRVLAAAITGTAGKPHLVDSGKEPTRALFLL